MRRVPRKQLHSDFVRAVRQSDRSIRTLTALAGFTFSTNVSPYLNLRPVPASQLNIVRLQVLAAVVDYDGPIFTETTR
jgi:hypothetical protein